MRCPPPILKILVSSVVSLAQLVSQSVAFLAELVVFVFVVAFVVDGGVVYDDVVGVVVVVVDPRNLPLKLVKIRSGTAEILLAFRSLWWWW